MRRMTGVLGLLSIVALVSCAIAAPAAQAVNFTSNSYPMTFSGGQTTKHAFTIEGQKAECNFAIFIGGLAAASATTDIEGAYSECTVFGFINGKIEMNGCAYRLNSAGTGTIACPAGKTITLVGGTCTVHIPPQTPTVNTVTYANEATGLKVTYGFEGIHYTSTSGFLCPLENTTTGVDGKYTGSTLFTREGGGSLDVG